MAGDSIKISTEQVLQIANNIEKLNERLSNELAEGKAAIDNLANIYQGKAAEATISAFDGFAAKYFQNYEDVIAQYVKFLRDNVARGYEETEETNTGLADSFK